ncbi:MAG: flagellar hook-basal body protein [Oscillospiraceae bacterium]|jgi:flagellar basal-body rod protein FlgG|nr:flagellar hook-basal body protein [Oscillospiraceae bacterium]
MYEALHIAATGLRNQQRRLDSIANNIANSNTVGYKAERLDFKTALYTAGIVPGPPYSPDANQQKGHGVMVTAVARDFFTGNMQTTENELDFAIEGKGFFEIEDASGNITYTRAGNFYVSTLSDGTKALVTGSGSFVRDADGQRITVPDGTTGFSASLDGELSFLDGTGSPPSVKLGIFTFTNETGLSSEGSAKFSETEVSGTKTTEGAGSLRQGTLEQSNVQLANEMQRMIRAQRAFSLSARALTTADDMEGIANAMRK